MLQLRNGALRLFRLFGIDVYLHWSWLIVAVFMVQDRFQDYQSPAWAVIEYMSLFGIVLLHEFGHALACRSVGGVANAIILWPLGGIAYVQPPPRPGAVLWSIAAGPLVNVLLVPVTFAVAFLVGWPTALLPGHDPDLNRFFAFLALMNLVLLVVNLFPIYPLDGGQIIQAVLWFFIGQVRSLLVVSVVGLIVGGVVLVGVVTLLAFGKTNVLLVILIAFIVLRSWVGFKAARTMSALLSAPRRRDVACPHCHHAPPAGPFWICDKCRTRFDTFAEDFVCPGCQKTHGRTVCPACRRLSPGVNWRKTLQDDVPEAAEISS